MRPQGEAAEAEGGESVDGGGTHHRHSNPTPNPNPSPSPNPNPNPHQVLTIATLGVVHDAYEALFPDRGRHRPTLLRHVAFSTGMCVTLCVVALQVLP